jgi:hypothetical protein
MSGPWEGGFDIRGLAAGRSRVKAMLSDDVRIEGDTDVEIVAHGCYDTYLATATNTTISGRIIIPPGVQVTGTQVTALRPNGRDVKSTPTSRTWGSSARRGRGRTPRDS